MGSRLWWHEAGGQAERLEVARDRMEEIRERVSEGRKMGLLLLSGGVSMGKYDLVEKVLAELGAEFYLHWCEDAAG